MKILLASVEVAPIAKVGGLADVAGSLPKALRAEGHDARIVMPAYAMCVEGMKPILSGVPVTVSPDVATRMTVWETSLDGVPVYLVGAEGHFDSTTRSEQLYAYGRDSYLFFAQAILVLGERLGWIPDLVHANDWHTGFLPVFVREKGGALWDRTATVFTIHNLQYQGTFGRDTLAAAGLPESLFTSERLENWGAVNFLKSACVYADQVNTVSPTYAEEIQTERYGVGQWGLMRDLARRGRLRGILNGIDYDHFNPGADADIAAPYSPSDLGGKAICKQELQAELNLPVSAGTPLVGIVSRLSDQKGFDLIVRQAYGMLAQGVQFVALGTGDPWAAEQLRRLREEWPENVHFAERYDKVLAQRIYAGSDLFLMPSAFEPCGLGQMIACRYGTVPIVRRTGGLADTIHERENGFVLEESSARELYDTLIRALQMYRNSEEWAALVRRCMEWDFSWSKSAQLYSTMYKDARETRLGHSLVSR